MRSGLVGCWKLEHVNGNNWHLLGAPSVSSPGPLGPNSLSFSILLPVAEQYGPECGPRPMIALECTNLQDASLYEKLELQKLSFHRDSFVKMNLECNRESQYGLHTELGSPS